MGLAEKNEKEKKRKGRREWGIRRPHFILLGF